MYSNFDIQVAYKEGAQAWEKLFSTDSEFEFPDSKYSDEWPSTRAKAFRKGFDDAARKDGYTYCRLTGEYVRGGEFNTDEFSDSRSDSEFFA